jgi:hypothetical protein
VRATTLEAAWTLLSLVGILAHWFALRDAIEDIRAVRLGLYNGARRLIAIKLARSEAINMAGQTLLFIVGVTALVTVSPPIAMTVRSVLTVGGLMMMQVLWIVRTVLDLRDARRLVIIYEKERG